MVTRRLSPKAPLSHFSLYIQSITSGSKGKEKGRESGKGANAAWYRVHFGSAGLGKKIGRAFA